LPKYTKLNSRGILRHPFAYSNSGGEEVTEAAFHEVSHTKITNIMCSIKMCSWFMNGQVCSSKHYHEYLYTAD